MGSDEECCRRAKDLLPATGILTKQGIPFYHLRRYALKSIHLQRIKQCGIELKNGQFSSEENKRLKKNWERYAAANNIDCSRAYEFAGGCSKEMSRNERINLLVFQNKTKFVPAMCEGFNDRTGRQVISRMLIVYHPGEKSRLEWNNELEKQFEKLYAEGCTPRAISIRLNRPKAEVDYRINILRRRTEKPHDCDMELDDSARQVLYGFVTKWLLSKNCPLELEEMLPEKEKWNVADFALLQDQEKAMSYLPWLSLTWKMSKEVERLRAACERFDGDTEKATDFCMPKLPTISVGEYRRALNLFLEQKPMFLNHLDVKQLQKRHEIEEENLVGYCTDGLMESEFLKRMLYIHISNFRKSVGEFLDVKNITCTDWITVLIEYLKHLDGSSRNWHCSMKHVRELVSKKLEKKCENILASSSGTDVNSNTNDTFPYSATSDKGAEDEQKNYASYIDDLEVNNISSQKSERNEEPISFNDFVEHYAEKLKNLIESRFLLFDEQRQRKFAKKLRKIMRKDEKLESLQRLVEKMIFNLEDEQKMKLNKKYQKIMRRIQKMQEKKSGNDIQYEFNEIEASNKSYSEGGETENRSDYSGKITEMTEEPKQLDSDTGFDGFGSWSCRSKRENQTTKGEIRAVGRNSISSELNELSNPIHKSKYEDIVPAPKKKNKRIKHGEKGIMMT
uniref:RING-type domain-containing protein n=1 Tax=Elaeophora elaphi TaxID=1147741 RepID=A0A0R3RY51_9BILA